MQERNDFIVRKSSAIAVFVFLFSFMGGYDFFTGGGGSIGWYLFYYGRFALLMLYVLYTYSYTMKVSYRQMQTSKMLLCMFVFPELVMFVYSIFLWIISQPELPYITRGISDTIFTVGAYFAGVSMAKVLGKDAFQCGLYAAFVTLILSSCLGIIERGTDFFAEAVSGGNRYLELHEAVFTVGLYIIYMVFTDGKFAEGRKKLLIFLAFVYFILGNKRIGLAALILALFFGLFVTRFTDESKKNIMKFFGNLIILLGFIYVFLTVSGKLTDLFMSLGISMSGREIIYAYFVQFCNFGVDFIGNGVGFVGRKFSYTTSKELLNMASVKALHNDFLKIYIDMGFVGFFLWMWYWIKFLPMKIVNKAGARNALICFTLLLYSFILYTTDNTAGYINYQMHLSMLIAIVVHNGIDEKNKCTEKY